MAEAIFVRSGGQLDRLEETAFPLEHDLQILVGQHPELLAGAQMRPDRPRRFALVSQEVPVPDQAGSPGRWALDHLFVDQDRLPTLVEVKRATNSQLRREVVGQLLDYAANAVRYWTAEDLADAFAATHGGEADAVLAELIGEEVDAEEFWRQVEANLGDGRVRLVFLADRIPTELQGIVEFLNERTDPVEVLAVELKQYLEPSGIQVLVPRVIGMTAVAKSVKRATIPFDELLEQASADAREVDRLLLSEAERHGWATSTTAKARRFRTSDDVHLFYLFPQYGVLELQMQTITQTHPDVADQILDALSGIVHRPLSDKHPQVPTADIADQWDRFASEVLGPYVQARRRAKLP